MGYPAQRARTARPRFTVSGRLFYGVFAGLLLTNGLTVVALLLAPDVGRLVSGHADQVLAAYEDRMADLRIEIDRLHSRSFAQTGDINLQLQELAQQQEILSEQHQVVKVLAEKAAELGLDSGTAAEPEPALLTGALRLPSAPPDLATTNAQVDRMIEESQLALAAITHSATQSTDQIVSELHRVGIVPRFDPAEGVGGPLLPPVADGDDADEFIDANAAMAALQRFKAARQAFDSAPVHAPLANPGRISSTFGNRKDPFNGRLAFHAGMDFPAPTGTTVLSAGAGTVIFVGQRSGYGNTVEIDHGGGIVTRYGHLSAFLVHEGQVVATGVPIAKVGSTGRSTGPHLHFEVRRDDVAVNPKAYLDAGSNLDRFAAA